MTAAGFLLNIVAAVLIYEEQWIAAGLAFLVGSILDIFDGAIARSRGEAGPRGAFIDSTFDRIAEGVVMGAIALVFARGGHEVAIAAVFAALAFSFLTSYTRARAEALGLDGIAGFMAPRGARRPDRRRARLRAARRARCLRAASIAARRALAASRSSSACATCSRSIPDHYTEELSVTAANGSKNGRRPADGKVRVAIVGVGNCASSLVQGVSYYRDAGDDDVRPRPDARRPRRLPRPRHRVRRRLRHRRRQGRQGPLRGDLRRPEQHREVRRRAEPRRQGRSAA